MMQQCTNIDSNIRSSDKGIREIFVLIGRSEFGNFLKPRYTREQKQAKKKIGK